MNEPVLPEDLSRWPSDPHELLGVERGVAPKDLKRVYTRLIKVWKPEHFPEHFRRIREAYESVLRYIEFFGRFEFVPQPESERPAEPIAEATTPIETAPDAPRFVDEPVIDPPAASIVDVNPELIVDPPAARIVDDAESIVDPPASRIVDAEPPAPPRNDPAALWERAIHGEEAAAYRGLKLLYRERPQQTTIALRLYWLLSLDPSLDAEMKPSEWLAAGLRNGGFFGPCMELYRRAIEADPEEAFSNCFEDLLKQDAPTGALAEVLSWRWIAVRRTKRWDVLANDLDLARERIGRLDDGAWFRLLLIACDGVAWIADGYTYSELWEALQNEIQPLQHLGNRHGEWFDRLEFLTTVRRDWQRLVRAHSVPLAFLDLVADGWHTPFQTYRAALIDHLGEMVDEPVQWLYRFDRVMEEGPNVLNAFAELLRQLEFRLAEPAPKPEPAVIHDLARVFMRGLTHYGSNFRRRVVRFCFREAIDPAWMIEPLLNHDIGWYSPVDPQRFVQIIEDWPVRYLCQAYRLFWMSG